MKRNVTIINKRKVVWDNMGYTYRDEPNRLYKNHWLSVDVLLQVCFYATEEET